MCVRSSPLALLALAACEAAPVEAPGPAPVAVVEQVSSEAASPPFEASVRSLRLKKSTTVRALPDERSAPLGVLAQDMRVGWRGAEPGPGCERWIEVEPRGFVCDQALEPSRLPPFALELPKLEPGAILPGIYGAPVGRAARKARLLAANGRYRQFRSLSVLLKFRDEVKVRGRSYFRTRLGELVDARQVRVREPSTFSGIEVGAHSALLPLAWVRSRTSPRSAVAVWSHPEDGELLGLLEPRSAVPILGETEDGLWARVGPDAWISLDDLGVARLAEPPAELGPADRWVDVDLRQQVLVAYQGRRPVFATLVSTGAARPTPEGSYRIWIKFAEADMKGDNGGRPYAVSSVPWTMYFEKDFALHGAYWHDGFGAPRSHGCVNLSPQDARRLYQWTAPHVPTGWSMSYAAPGAAGSLVRIRRSVSSFNDVPPQRYTPTPAKVRLSRAVAARDR